MEIISVIVPIYNTGEKLHKCVKSIIKQTYQELDIILIDDGSTDESLVIAKEYEKEDKRIRVFSQSNSGLIATRKKGIELAKGDYIGFVDSDDWIEENMYEQLISIMKEDNCDLISSGIFYNYESSLKQTEVYDNYDAGLYTNLKVNIFRSMLYDCSIDDMGLKCNLVSKLFVKKKLEKIYEKIDTRVFYGEDALALYMYCLECESIYILKKAYYHYLIHFNSMCRVADERLLTNTFYLYKELKEKFDQREDFIQLNNQLKQYVLKLESHTLKMIYGINIDSLGEWNCSNLEKYLNKKICLYGAGKYGNAIYNYFKKNEREGNIVVWVDKKANYKSVIPGEAVSVDFIVESEFDYIIIAVKNEGLAISIKNEIMEKYHINEDIIIWEEIMENSIFRGMYCSEKDARLINN